MECVGQGIANTATGFIGGMAGCAMIGQSIINVKSGGRGRLSTFVAGAMLLFIIVVLGDSVADPDGGPGGDHDHGLDRHLQLVLDQEPATHPRSSSVVMLATVPVRGLHPQSRHRRAGRRAAVGHFFAWKIAQLFRVRSRCRKTAAPAPTSGGGSAVFRLRR
jgi:SulP family sulfate permease